MCSTPPSAGEDLLSEYLAESDEQCPGCGYNLRGMTGRLCPECGCAFTLGLRATSALHRRRMLLLLIFLWLLLGGGLSAVRDGRSIYRVVTAPSQTAVVSSMLAQVPLFEAMPSDVSVVEPESVLPTAAPATEAPPTPEPVAVPEDVTVRVTHTEIDLADTFLAVLPEVNGAWTTNGSANTSRSIRVLTAPTAMTSQGTWSRVTWRQWATVSGWASLAIVGAVGLATLFTFRRGQASPRVARFLLVLAWTGFGASFAYRFLAFA